ncbi:MAG: hypothetical protein C0524_14560 [Rhodobacter sp.]|nr:hypothetical protein [Rhodobacter sp.]
MAAIPALPDQLARAVGRVAGSGPAKLELTCRNFCLGSATGGNPVEALNPDFTGHVILLSLRIPL